MKDNPTYVGLEPVPDPHDPQQVVVVDVFGGNQGGMKLVRRGGVVAGSLSS